MFITGEVKVLLLKDCVSVVPTTAPLGSVLSEVLISLLVKLNTAISPSAIPVSFIAVTLVALSNFVVKSGVPDKSEYAPVVATVAKSAD